MVNQELTIQFDGTSAFAHLPERFTPAICFKKLNRLSHCAWLDSALQNNRLGRYSYLAADPFKWAEIWPEQLDSYQSGEILANFREAVKAYDGPNINGLPPFQGGAISLLGYELGQNLESIPPPTNTDFRTPV